MMPRRNGKKSKNTSEKKKREMGRKKQKDELKDKPVDSTADKENCDWKQNLQIERQAVADHECLSESMMRAGDTGNGSEIKGEPDKRNMSEDVTKNKGKEKNAMEDKKTEMVVFCVGEEEFALRISSVKEIIRIPSMAKLPNTPQHITGLCSLRGELLPVIDLRKLFGMTDREFNESSRIIVADIHGKKVGLVSDRVSEVINIKEAAIKEPPDNIRGIDGGIINGILILNNGKRIVLVLNGEKIVKAGNLDVALNRQYAYVENLTDLEQKEDEEEQIVVFNIGTAEYAFNINYVKEIIRLPGVMKVPNTASYIEGVFSVRNQIMAVINPGKLLGVNCKQPDENCRVMIIDNGGFSYGVIVDKVSQVVRVQKKLFRESVRNETNGTCSGAEFVRGIFNLNNDTRLIMMLDPHKLISLEDMKGVLDIDHGKTINDKSLYAAETDNNLEYIVFKLGGEEYGININNVQEVNRIS